MARTKGSKNNNSAAPSFFHLSIEERVDLLANLMVDKIVEDQTNGHVLLRKIDEEAPCTTSQQVAML